MVEFAYTYPRYASTPMETFGVIAQFEQAPDRFTVWSNFQGPFVLQPLMAGALKVAGQSAAPDHAARIAAAASASSRRCCPTSC